MTYFDPEDFEGVQPKMVTLRRDQIRTLEEKAKKADELEARLAQLERSTVFDQAGIPNEGPGVYFRKGYDGELSVDAIREAFGQPAPTSQGTAPALQGHQLASAMSAGAQTATTSGGYAELENLRAKVRARKNAHMGFAAENDELNSLLAREGVGGAPDTSKWQLPKQLT